MQTPFGIPIIDDQGWCLDNFGILSKINLKIDNVVEGGEQ